MLGSGSSQKGSSTCTVGEPGGRTAHATATVEPSALNLTPAQILQPAVSSGPLPTRHSPHASAPMTGGSTCSSEGSQ